MRLNEVMEVRVGPPEAAAGLVGVTVGDGHGDSAQLFPPGMKTGQKETDKFSREVSVGHKNSFLTGTNSGRWASPATTPNTEAPLPSQSWLRHGVFRAVRLASQRTVPFCTQDQTLGT